MNLKVRVNSFCNLFLNFFLLQKKRPNKKDLILTKILLLKARFCLNLMS